MKLVFDIQSFWLCGTGQGALASANQTAIRTPEGLPFIPGKTVKGVIKHALREWQQLIHGDSAPGDRALVDGALGESICLSEQLFGGQPDQGSPPIRGALRIASATLDQEEIRFLTREANQGLIRNLYQMVSSTAIDPGTVSAKNHSLRTREVVVPLKLQADVTWVHDADFRTQLPDNWREVWSDSLALVNSIGAGKTRGLGRCRVTLEDME